MIHTAQRLSTRVGLRQPVSNSAGRVVDWIHFLGMSTNYLKIQFAARLFKTINDVNR